MNSESFVSIKPTGKEGKRRCDWTSTECGLHRLCPCSVAKNSVTRSHLVARKAWIYNLAICPGEKMGLMNILAVCHICQRQNVLTLDPRVRSKVSLCARGGFSSSNYRWLMPPLFSSSAYCLRIVMPLSRNQLLFNMYFLGKDSDT